MLLQKNNTYTNDIIFIDGLWGSGKSLLAPIISSMNLVEKVKIDSIYEYISLLNRLKKIDEDAAIWMMRSYVDMSQYHNVIGREVNLRWKDDSGLRFSPDKFGLLMRLFGGEGDAKAVEIDRKNIGFCAMSHMLMLTPDLLTPSFGDRVKVIEMVRHPLYLIEHFKAYLSRFDSPREFTMSFYKSGKKIPWFALDWEYDYIHASDTERAVLCVVNLYRSIFKEISLSRNNGLAVLDISFEQIIFDPIPVLSALEKFTGRGHNKSIFSILKKQKLPRHSVGEGRGHDSYGWSIDSSAEGDAYQRHAQTILANTSDQLLQTFRGLIRTYNNNYPSKMCEFQELL